MLKAGWKENEKIFFLWLLPLIWGVMTLVLYQCGQNPFVYGTLPATLALSLSDGWIHFHPIRATFVAGVIMMGTSGILLDILRISKKTWVICFGFGCAAALVLVLILSLIQRAVPDNIYEICAVIAIIANWGLVFSVPGGIIWHFVDTKRAGSQKALESMAKSM
jgi:hypothetical protein